MPRRLACPTGLLLAALALAACSSDKPDVTPSPLPPGYRPVSHGLAEGGAEPEGAEEKGQELDAVMAVVEGEVITRRRLVRESGGRAKGQDEAAFEAQLRRRLMDEVQLQLFVKEAQRAGVTIDEGVLDKLVREELDRRVKEASKRTGEPVTTEAYLREQGLTMGEFRESARRQLYRQAYMIRLVRGLGGPTRPMVDMTVSPAEVRRLFWSHPGAFDEKPAVRPAAFSLPVSQYDPDKVGFLEAEKMATADAQALAARLRAGDAPEALAARFHVPAGQWTAPDAFVGEAERDNLVRSFGAEGAAWLLAPERRTGEATVVSTGDGSVVLGVLARRPGRTVPFEEAAPKIVEIIRFAREARLERQRLIQILSTHNVVQPPEVANALLLAAREDLRKLEEDPILGAARFR
jgi:hypothetical protein